MVFAYRTVSNFTKRSIRLLLNITVLTDYCSYYSQQSAGGEEIEEE